MLRPLWTRKIIEVARRSVRGGRGEATMEKTEELVDTKQLR